MNIQTLLTNILTFLNGTIVPFLLAVATFIFIWNALRYFVLDGSNEESQQKARSLAFWGIGAFVIIVSLWGVVNLIVNGLGFARPVSITPDYIDSKHIAPDDWGAGSNLSTGSDADCARTDTCFDP